MRRPLLTLFLLALTTTANAQQKLEDFIKPGAKLIYGVEYLNDYYTLIITIKDKKGTSFDWEMTAPASISGRIVHSPKALLNGNKMLNHLTSGTTRPDGQTLCVWLSQNVFNTLSKTKNNVKLFMDEPDGEATDMRMQADQTLNITVDGKEIKFHEIIVRPVKKNGNDWVMEEDSDKYFSFNNSASFPIILRLQTDIEIYLQEIKNK